jgi:hypothetical protein
MSSPAVESHPGESKAEARPIASTFRDHPCSSRQGVSGPGRMPNVSNGEVRMRIPDSPG